MADIAKRFSQPFTVGRATAWRLLRTGTEVRKVGTGGYRVLFSTGAYMQNASGAARSFRSLENAMTAAVEHAGG